MQVEPVSAGVPVDECWGSGGSIGLEVATNKTLFTVCRIVELTP